MKFNYLIAIALFLSATEVNAQNARPYERREPVREPLVFEPGNISTEDDDFGGTFSPDGTTVFFSKSALGSYFYVICYSEFVNGRWSKPRIAPFSGTYRDFDPVFSPDGKKILFASDRPVAGEKKTDYDIWMVERTGAGWSNPVHLEAPVNSEYDEHFASIAANGNIYFSSNRPGADGGDFDADVYRTRLVDGKYLPAEHLGAEA